MAHGQAQHCIVCGSPAHVMEKGQTLCVLCATVERSEDGTPSIEWTCPSCFSPGSMTLRESGFRVCNECWNDEDTRSEEEVWGETV